MRTFEFEKTYEEITIGEKVYRLDFNDEKLKEYATEIQKFHKRFLELDKVNHKDMSDKQALQHFDDIKELMRGVVEQLLGKGTFDEIYEQSGKSIMNVFDFVMYLKTVIDEKSHRNLDNIRKKYVKK